MYTTCAWCGFEIWTSPPFLFVCPSEYLFFGRAILGRLTLEGLNHTIMWDCHWWRDMYRSIHTSSLPTYECMTTVIQVKGRCNGVPFLSRMPYEHRCMTVPLP